MARVLTSRNVVQHGRHNPPYLPPDHPLQVCTKFGASDVGLELEQLPDGKVRVALL